MYRSLFALIAAVALIACGGTRPSAPTPNTQATIEAAVRATQAAQPSPTPPPTATATATAPAPTATFTAVPTATKPATATPTNTPIAPTPTPKAIVKHFDQSNWDELQADPRQYIGSTVEIYSTALGAAEHPEGGTLVQLVDAYSDLNVLVSSDKNVKIGDGDEVAVTGTVVDVYEGESKSGDRLVLPWILADSITVTATAEEIAHPKVTYKVTGTARRASLMYYNSSGGSEQRTVRLPWQMTFGPEESEQFLYISAQNEGDSGTITCEILVNGHRVKRSTSSGAYVIATCDATGP